MRELMLHIKYRSRRIALVLALFLGFTLLLSYGSLPVRGMQTQVFEVWYDENRSGWIMFAFVLLQLLMILMFVRDDMHTRNRILLLPQKRMIPLLGDALLLLLMDALFFILVLTAYYISFHQYIQLLEEHHITWLHQTRDVWVSMRHTTVLSSFVSFDFLAIAKTLLAVAWMSGACLYISRYLLLQRTQRNRMKEVLFGGCAITLLLAWAFLQEWIVCICLVIGCWCIWKLLESMDLSA